MFAGIAGAVIFGESLLAESEHTLSGARMAFTLKEKKRKHLSQTIFQCLNLPRASLWASWMYEVGADGSASV